MIAEQNAAKFWSSAELTGNQTHTSVIVFSVMFWSSVELTGNQTFYNFGSTGYGFGAVSN